MAKKAVSRGPKPIKVHITHLGPGAPNSTKSFKDKEAANKAATKYRNLGYRVSVEDTSKKKK
jgi:hypothetical protein